MISQDRFIELVTKEFIRELTEDEAKELKSLLQNREILERYNLFKLYLSNNKSDNSSDERLFQNIQKKIKQQEGPPEDGLSIVKKRPLLWRITVAASLVLLLSATFYTLHQNESITNQVTYTKRAGKTSITLSDGTRVTLNSESKLSYPKQFSGKSREVTLVGEAFFDVYKDANHPFIIHTDKMDVKVLGTAFNVKAYPGDKFVETTLIRGLVEVTMEDRPSDVITLRPSEKLTINVQSSGSGAKTTQNDALARITHLQKRDTTVVETSWMYGKVIFQDEAFDEVLKRLERTYNVKINLQNESLKELKFTAAFERESIDGVLKALSVVEPFNYSIKNDQIVIK